MLSEIPPLEHENISDLFESMALKYKNKSCLSSFGKTISYKKFHEIFENFASYLQNELKLKKGDAIAIQMYNTLPYMVSVLAGLKLGLKIVNANPLYTERELQKQLKDSQAKAIVIFSGILPKFEKIQKETSVEHVIVTSLESMMNFPKSLIISAIARFKNMNAPLKPEHICFDQALKKGAQKTFQKIYIDSEDTAFIQYTGGTTGVSKGACLSHRNILSNISQIDLLLKSSTLKQGEEVAVIPLPLYHIYAATISLCLLSYGSKIILVINPRDLSSFIKVFKNEKPTLFMGINTLFIALNNYAPFRQLQFPTLKLSLAGGMPIQKPVVENWEKITNTPIYEGYGLTETSPVVAVNPLHQKPHYGTIGTPVASTDIKIIDSQFKEVELGQPGEICVKGPQVMKGYWQKPEENKKVFHEGWFRTGDIGFMDEEGYITIVDRCKDMILVSGFNVYPNEIEEVVMKHNKVLEAAAIGVPHEKSGEAVKLFVVSKKGTKLTEHEVKTHCRKYLTNYKNPKFIEFKNNLPKSNIGKILRRELRN